MNAHLVMLAVQDCIHYFNIGILNSKHQQEDSECRAPNCKKIQCLFRILRRCSNRKLCGKLRAVEVDVSVKGVKFGCSPPVCPFINRGGWLEEAGQHKERYCHGRAPFETPQS